MGKQRNLVALDWLMPVLKDVFDELNQLLQRHDEPKQWQAIKQSFHQVNGALTLANQPLLAKLALVLEKVTTAIANDELSTSNLIQVKQALALLQYEMQQAQGNQQVHADWVMDRLDYFSELLGEPVETGFQPPKTSEQLPLVPELPIPTIKHQWQAENVQNLTKLWRYCSLQLLKQQKNDPKSLEDLSELANYLASSNLKAAFRQVWNLTAVWLTSLLLNDEPTPKQYAVLLDNLSSLLHHDNNTLPDLETGRLAINVLLELNNLTHKTDNANQLLANLNINNTLQNDTVFSQVLQKLEKTIYQINEPLAILPILESIKSNLANRGWVYYEHQLSQIIDDVRLMTQDGDMAATLSWQVERQLQDLYSQLLTTVDTLDSEIGLSHFTYSADPEKEAVRQTRVHLENVKLAFNQYSQLHDLAALAVNDDLVAMIQVFGALGLNRPKELMEQLRLLFSRIHKQQVNILSWEATDAIAEMVARFELFLDYLSHQSVSEELLDQTQAQLNRANQLINRLIESPLNSAEIDSRAKVFEANTLVYDDEGEKVISSPQTDNAPEDLSQNSQEDSLAEATESEALLIARQSLKEDDYSMDEEIREIFIEEADEVLGEMDEQLPVWQANPHDLTPLKEIRRGFHTLKGSGRMVGANQVGETAWAVENMLNRVLDGTLPISDELVGFIKDTRQSLPILIEDYSQQRQPSIDPAITVLQATNLLQQQPINTGLNTTNQTQSIAVSETTFEDENHLDTATQAIAQPTKMDSTSLAATGLPAAVQQAYDQLAPVTDEVTDPDIQEIYIEEAKEVLETITPLYQDWQHDTQNVEVLKEIRRGFHTLKGSGRMVGANQLGELAWAIENMLNRVLDHTIVADEGLVALVGDVIHEFDGLIEIFAQNRTDYPQSMKLWAATANAYTQKQGETFDYLTMLSQSHGHTPVASSMVEPSPSQEEIVSTDESKITDTVANAEETDDVFLEEAHELLTKIKNFVKKHQGSESTYISDELVRAFHTLRGGAALLELSRVYALSAAFEEQLGDLLRKENTLNASQLAVIDEAQQKLQEYINDFENHALTDVQSEDKAEIDALIQRLINQNETNEPQAQLSVQELMALNIDELLDADQQAHEIFAGDTDDIVAYAATLEHQAHKLTEAMAGLTYTAIPETLQYSYAKFTKYPQFAKDENIYQQLMGLHAQLINMFDAIAAGLKVNIDEEAIGQLKKLLAEKQYQADMDAIEYEAVGTDIELLEIFLEESQSLQPIVQQNFNQWQNNLSNTESVKELRRQFHTLKGGANMVGIQSMAAMAQRAERLYDAIDKGKLESDADTALIMQRVHETIATQLKQIIDLRRSFYANDLIEQLDAILAGTLSTRDIQLNVPLIVGSMQDEQLHSEVPLDADGGSTGSNDPLYIQEIINNFEQHRLETWGGQEPDEDILNVYLEEAKELIDSSSQHLQEFRSNNSNIAALQALQRELHTIKGGARMVGAEGIATLAHEMESIYEELGSRRKPATRMIGNLLAACHDWLASSLYVLENKYNPETPTTLIRALQGFSHNPDSLKEIPTANLTSQIEQIDIYKSSLNQDSADIKQRDLTVIPPMQGNFESEQEQTNLNAEMLRVSAGLMERMINLSGESAINRSRIEMGVSSLTNSIEEMGSTVQRLADQLRRMETELEIQILAQIGEEHGLDSEFDPLEMDQYSSLNQLSKSLSESASDLLDIKTTMLDKTRDTENLLLQLSRTQTDLQEGLMDSRTVPFSRITPRLQRIVRQTATELGKSVELRILNDEGEIDRNILERITSPLEHMLRNAVDHGIEKSQERIEHGKSRTGLITLEVQREGGEIVINLIDDGRGINVEAVRQKAIEQGLISGQDTSLKPLDIMQYIFNAGLSTAKSVSQISGRGVGMDVVQSEVKQLGGVVLVDSEVGRGSRFTMRLPLTVAISDALMVRAGDKYFAVPLVQIERVTRINVETIYNFYETNANTINIEGEDYRLRYLNQILFGSDPLDALRQHTSSVPVIVIRTELGQHMALQVDMIAGSRIEVVVKPLGRQLSHISGISAATIMGDGSVMLILDLIALMRNTTTSIRADRQKSIAKANEVRKPVVLIVDDSVTVRKVTSRLLERNGYEAQVATDGVDALEKLQDLTPDVMLLDIEMPRMDGFEVANHVRHHSRLKNVPIIMITSRTGEKHRERALNIGVNEYMGKPFQEQALLNTIEHLVKQSVQSSS